MAERGGMAARCGLGRCRCCDAAAGPRDLRAAAGAALGALMNEFARGNRRRNLMRAHMVDVDHWSSPVLPSCLADESRGGCCIVGGAADGRLLALFALLSPWALLRSTRASTGLKERPCAFFAAQALEHKGYRGQRALHAGRGKHIFASRAWDLHPVCVVCCIVGCMGFVLYAAVWFNTATSHCPAPVVCNTAIQRNTAQYSNTAIQRNTAYNTIRPIHQDQSILIGDSERARASRPDTYGAF